MEVLLFIALLVIARFVFKSRSRQNSVTSFKTESKSSVTRKSITTNQDDQMWLEYRWSLAKEQQFSGRGGIFPKWYFDEVTERQLQKLEELGVSVGRMEITKGQASDIIGMHEPAEEKSIEILKFFKMPTRGLKQTHARHEVAQLFQVGENVEAWEKRPPSVLQKEFFKFFGIKIPKGTTHEQAYGLIFEYESEMRNKGDPRLKEWEAYKEIIDELSDPDFREDYNIRKPSSALIKRAIAELQKEDKSYQDISEDIDILIDKLIELEPELSRD